MVSTCRRRAERRFTRCGRGGPSRRTGGSGGYSSRHVVVKVEDPTDGPIYNVYLHLDSIDPAVVTGGSVVQGQLIGTVGDDDATYRHLHFEFRKGTFRQIGSVHPLTYLPYTDTANFSAARRRSLQSAGRVHGRAHPVRGGSKLEGDLKRVEVDLRSRNPSADDPRRRLRRQAHGERGEGRPQLFVDDIGVEGYQKSDMVKHGQPDLAYGILVRKIPRRCDTLVARVFDVGGNVVTTSFDRGPRSDRGRRIRRFRGRPTAAGRMDQGHQRGRKRDAGVDRTRRRALRDAGPAVRRRLDHRGEHAARGHRPHLAAGSLRMARAGVVQPDRPAPRPPVKRYISCISSAVRV